MSYLLSNPSTKLLQALSRESWSRILSLARFYGWQPMGTLPPFIHNLRGLAYESGAYEAGNHGVWDGTYLRNEGQVVQATDALGMAIALEMSLDDIPDVNPERDITLEDDLPEWLSPTEKALIRDGLVDHEYNVSRILPFEYFAGDAKQNLIEFIRFCMLGEFVIS